MDRLEPEWGFSPQWKPNHAGTLILDLLTPKLLEISVGCLSHPVYGICILNWPRHRNLSNYWFLLWYLDIWVFLCKEFSFRLTWSNICKLAYTLIFIMKLSNSFKFYVIIFAQILNNVHVLELRFLAVCATVLMQ